MTIKILNILAFCLFSMCGEKSEVGIASGNFSDEDWCKGDREFKLSQIRNFGWIDRFGKHYVNHRTHFTRPTESQVIATLSNSPELLQRAVKKGIIEVSYTKVNK